MSFLKSFHVVSHSVILAMLLPGVETFFEDLGFEGILLYSALDVQTSLPLTLIFISVPPSVAI